MVSVGFGLITRGDNRKVVEEVKGRGGEVPFNLWRKIGVYWRVFI